MTTTLFDKVWTNDTTLFSLNVCRDNHSDAPDTVTAELLREQWGLCDCNHQSPHQHIVA